jgi:sugar phosphate permease
MIMALGLSAIVAGCSSHPWMMCISYALSGISLGLSAPACNAVWPHFYGTRHIGSIKGFYDTVRNSFTALSPLGMALALDAQHSIQNILLAMGAITLIIAMFPSILWTNNRKADHGIHPHVR